MLEYLKPYITEKNLKLAKEWAITFAIFIILFFLCEMATSGKYAMTLNLLRLISMAVMGTVYATLAFIYVALVILITIALILGPIAVIISAVGYVASRIDKWANKK